MEYIDKIRLLDDIERIDISNCTDVDDIFAEVEKTIDELSTVDVSEIVKCKDCKNYELMKSNNCHFCNEFGGYVTEKDFCSRAQKMDGGTNDDL